MKRGDVYWVNFDPAQGCEIQKIRPAIIVSNDGSNRALGRVQVVPLTSNTERLFPSETLVYLNFRHSKAVANQTRTVDKSRLKGFIGRLTFEDMQSVDHCLLMQLGLLITDVD